MQPPILNGKRTDGKLFSFRGHGNLMVALLLLCAMLVAAAASAQRRVFTNEDIAAVPEAPPMSADAAAPETAAPEAVAASAPAADSPAPGQASAQAPAAEPAPLTETQQLSEIVVALGRADEFLGEKIPDEPSTIIVARWTTMRNQLVIIMGEFRRILEMAQRAAPAPAAPPETAPSDVAPAAEAPAPAEYTPPVQ